MTRRAHYRAPLGSNCRSKENGTQHVPNLAFRRPTRNGLQHPRHASRQRYAQVIIENLQAFLIAPQVEGGALAVENLVVAKVG